MSESSWVDATDADCECELFPWFSNNEEDDMDTPSSVAAELGGVMMIMFLFVARHGMNGIIKAANESLNDVFCWVVCDSRIDRRVDCNEKLHCWAYPVVVAGSSIIKRK